MKQMIEVTMPTGESKTVVISHFTALEGWDIQHRFLEFAASTDKEVRRKYTFDVLAYAHVMVRDRELPLSTDALIDNHLQTWTNVQKVFEEVLTFNGIDPKTHADNPSYWIRAGEEMAVSFIAALSQFMGPSLQKLMKDQETENG